MVVDRQLVGQLSTERQQRMSTTDRAMAENTIAGKLTENAGVYAAVEIEAGQTMPGSLFL